MKTSFLLLALLLLPAVASAETASHHLGIEVDVPEGYVWKQGFKFKPTTVIYLEGAGEDANPPAIIINAINMGRKVPSEELFKQTREVLSDGDAQEVTLGSGRYLRVDFDIELATEEGGSRKLRQRCYARMRGTFAFYFFLANLEPERFTQHVATFDALVAGARYSDPRPAPAKPEVAKPEPAKPEVAKPEPAKPEVVAKPEPAKPEVVAKPEPAKPEVVAKPEPAKPKPANSPKVAGQVGQPLPLKLIRWDSEYDPDIWAATHLLDGKPDRGWCSSPSDKAPFSFVFELPRPTRIAGVGFDNACPEERGFEGVASSEFVLEGSNLGPKSGYQVLLEGKLEAGKNGQIVPLPRVAEYRYLQLKLLTNHGHDRLTELMEFRAFAPQGEDPSVSSFHLDRVRASREKNGTPETLPFRAGERVWVNFKPRAMSVNEGGTTHLEVDLVLGDVEGNELVRRNKVVNHVAKPPTPPLSNFVSLYLDLPAGFPAGKYVVRLLARDRVGETSAAAKTEFLVGE